MPLLKYKVGIVPLDIFRSYQTKFDMPFGQGYLWVICGSGSREIPFAICERDSVRSSCH